MHRPFCSYMLSDPAVNGSETGGDLVLIKTSLILLSKSSVQVSRNVILTIKLCSIPDYIQDLEKNLAQTRPLDKQLPNFSCPGLN